jgi:penicillin-binding protein 1A
VDNSAGETLVEHAHPVQAARVLSEPSAQQMQKLLHYVVTSGIGPNADISGLYVMGKTGTTSDNKDVWFMGATKQLSCGIWMGYDRPSELHDSSGGGWCAPAWRAFMEKANDIWSNRDPVQKLVESARATQLRRIQAYQDKNTSTNPTRKPRSIDEGPPSNASSSQRPSDQQSIDNTMPSQDQSPTNPPAQSYQPPSSPENSSPSPRISPSAPVRRDYSDGDSGSISGGSNSPIPNQP